MVPFAPMAHAIVPGTVASIAPSLDRAETTGRLRSTLDEIFPICRSITGDGVRATLGIVDRQIPLVVHEVPTGTPVLDWVVPKEWNARGAYIADSSGRRVVDFADTNLHLVGYSIPVRGRFALSELQDHLWSLSDRPNLVPYRTSYYSETWGFCLAQDRRDALAPGEYDVVVDTTLEDGALTYGEVLLPGEEPGEILLTTHVCHPSMANDNCTGIAVLAELGRLLSGVQRRHSVRLLFIPGTIGSISWLARNADRVEHIRHGLVLTGLGDPGPLTYKRSRRGDTLVDRAAAHVLAQGDEPSRIVDFTPYGYDERQFCSPGFDLAVGRMSRTPHGEYPEYHTSGDDLAFVHDASLVQSLEAVLRVLDDPRGGSDLRQPAAEGRAATRSARPVSRDRRCGRRAGCGDGIALGSQPVGRHTESPGRRGACGAAVRGRARRGIGARSPRSPRRGRRVCDRLTRATGSVDSCASPRRRCRARTSSSSNRTATNAASSRDPSVSRSSRHTVCRPR